MIRFSEKLWFSYNLILTIEVQLKKFLILFLIAGICFPQAKTSKIAGMAGSFSRMGFGARGMGMGNAVSSIVDGNLVAYYNPALSVFQKENSFQAAYSVLSLDRSLNFINFTRHFEFATKDTNRKFNPTAGLSIGIINSGVSKIDGRDNQGIKTGDLTTSESQFFLSFANKFSRKLVVGLSAKLYYYKLYEKITASGLGFDLGAIYTINDQLHLSFMISDLNSKYKWDTSPIYDTDGNTTENKFPLLKKIGASYRFNNPKLIIATEFENSNAGTNYIRVGSEYNIYDQLFLRAGIDKWNLSNSEFPARPSFGFSYFKDVSDYTLGVDYAFVIEPYSDSSQHIIGINFNF